MTAEFSDDIKIAKVIAAGIMLHDFIRNNAGETADWPIQIGSSESQPIERLDELLKRFKKCGLHCLSAFTVHRTCCQLTTKVSYEADVCEAGGVDTGAVERRCPGVLPVRIDASDRFQAGQAWRVTGAVQVV